MVLALLTARGGCSRQDHTVALLSAFSNIFSRCVSPPPCRMTAGWQCSGRGLGVGLLQKTNVFSVTSLFPKAPGPGYLKPEEKRKKQPAVGSHGSVLETACPCCLNSLISVFLRVLLLQNPKSTLVITSDFSADHFLIWLAGRGDPCAWVLKRALGSDVFPLFFNANWMKTAYTWESERTDTFKRHSL